MIEVNVENQEYYYVAYVQFQDEEVAEIYLEKEVVKDVVSGSLIGGLL